MNEGMDVRLASSSNWVTFPSIEVLHPLAFLMAMVMEVQKLLPSKSCAIMWDTRCRQ